MSGARAPRVELLAAAALVLAGFLGCTVNEPASPPARAAQAIIDDTGAVGSLGNPAELSVGATAVATGGPSFQATGPCSDGTSRVNPNCPCDLRWYDVFSAPRAGQPDHAAVALAVVAGDHPELEQYSVRVCKFANGLADCAGGLVASSASPVVGPTGGWMLFDLNAAGAVTLSAGERAALEVTAHDARTPDCGGTPDSYSVMLPNVGPDIPLGPDSRSDNQLWSPTGNGLAKQDFEPVFAVTFDNPDSGNEVGVGTPYNGGHDEDRLDSNALGQAFNAQKQIEVLAVGIAVTKTGNPPPPGYPTGSFADATGTAFGPTLTFDTNADGGSFYWANLATPLVIASGGGQLRLTKVPANPANHWAWHRDAIAPEAANGVPDDASFQGGNHAALGLGQPGIGPGDDYVFLISGFACQPTETCGDGLDNDCNGVPDDCPASTGSGSGSGSGTSTASSTAGSSSGSGSSASSSASGSTAGSSASSSGSGTMGTGTSASSTGTSSSSSSSSASSTGTSSSGAGTFSSSGSGGRTLGGSATGGNPLPVGPDKFALSGCGCQTLADPGFGALALLLLGLRRRKRG